MAVLEHVNGESGRAGVLPAVRYRRFILTVLKYLFILRCLKMKQSIIITRFNEMKAEICRRRVVFYLKTN